MIRTIQSIKDFGVFRDFRWPADLPEFKKCNLIYGWNYSGKTTLSRAFRCFELEQPHVDFASAQVQLRADDGTIHHLSASRSAPIFRVFNTDFVRENLFFDAGSATPILVLGAEDIAKQEALKTKKAERTGLASSKESNQTKREERKSAIEKALTNYARDFIKNPLTKPNYDKRDFEPKVTACKINPETHLLDEKALAQCFSIYRSTEKKTALSPKVVSLSSVAQLADTTASLLARVVTANKPLLRLKENAAVERWVKEGRSLHEAKNTCQFCGQQLPPDLMTHLTEHFSAEYDNLMAALDALGATIQAAQKEETTLDHKADFYPELAEPFTTEKNQLDELLKARKSSLESLAQALTEKQTKAFTSLECPPVNDPAPQIATAVEAINKTISEHNNRTAQFDKKRQEAFVKLEKHYAASFVRDQKYNEQLRQIAELTSRIAEQGKKVGELDAEIRALEEAVSEASMGAERINELLAAYFSKEDLRIAVSADKRFQIVRGAVIAKNLSEGEETAIAFAYFITRVHDGRHPLGGTIVVVDDPVSSLDANHIFNTYALIKTQLAGCCQLFIATHSFEFYNLMREWAADEEGRDHAKKPQSTWKRWGVFYMKRTDNGEAVLQEIPKELLRFKSEYHYLFWTLYNFDEAGTGEFDCLLSLPNVARRFMEAFGGIMIPLSMGLYKKMERLFSDEVERERVWKFINYYSHNITIMRSLAIPDVSECRAVVKACLRAVEKWNGDYFKDLERAVS